MIHEIGPHRVRHGDITDGLDDLMQGEQADLFYTDPPWGRGALKMWQTLTRKDTGASPAQVEYARFMDALFTAAVRYSRGLILIEYGVKWEDELPQVGTSYGLHYVGRADTQYKSGGGFRPAHLHVFQKQPAGLPGHYIDGMQGQHGLNLVRAAVSPVSTPGGILLDPLCGLGMMGQVASEAGMRFRGNEINAKRLDKTLSRLRKASKHAHLS